MTESNIISSMQSLVYTMFFPASESGSLIDTLRYYTGDNVLDLDSLGKNINKNVFIYFKSSSKYVYKFRSIVDMNYIHSQNMEHDMFVGISKQIMDKFYPCIKSSSNDGETKAYIEWVYRSGGTECVLVERQDNFFRALSYRGKLIFDKSVLEPDIQKIFNDSNQSLNLVIKNVDDPRPSNANNLIKLLASRVAEIVSMVEPRPKKIVEQIESQPMFDKIMEQIMLNYGEDSEVKVTTLVYIDDLIKALCDASTFASRIMKDGGHITRLENHYINVLERYNKKIDSLFVKIEKKFNVTR
jgi:hypothetical protein